MKKVFTTHKVLEFKCFVLDKVSLPQEDNLKENSNKVIKLSCVGRFGSATKASNTLS